MNVLKNSRFFIFGFAVTLTIVSCGTKSSKIENSITTYKSLSVSKLPVKLFKSDNKCKDRQIIEESQARTQHYINGGLRTVTNSFKLKENKLQTQGLVSSGIYKSTYNSKYSEVYTYKFDYKEAEYNDLLNAQYNDSRTSKEVNFCSSSNKYGRLTIEAATINVNKTIDHVSKRFKKVFPSIELDNIILDIAPIQEIIIRKNKGPHDQTKSTYYRTDGASYNPLTKKISFYPPSKEILKDNNFPFFWEIPTVAAHEYGHHIFNSITSSGSAEFSTSHDIGCFSNNYTFIEQSSNNEGKRRPKLTSFSLKALNESFADLFAFYTLPKSKRKLRNLNCLSNVREVDSNKFSSKDLKAFSTRSIDILNKDTFVKSDNTCITPNYQEVHDVGATFAFGFNNLISKYTSNRKTKLKILIKWLELLKDEYFNMMNMKPSDFLYHSLELALISASHIKNIAIEELNCSDLDVIFPNEFKQCIYLK